MDLRSDRPLPSYIDEERSLRKQGRVPFRVVDKPASGAVSAPQVREVKLTPEQLVTIRIALANQLRQEQQIAEILNGKKDLDIALRNLDRTKDALKATQP